MGSTSVTLVDINSSSASATWPLLMKAIGGADFVSIDLELSGLGQVTSSKTRTMEDHYQFLSEVVGSRAILSLGVACFKWGEGSQVSAGPVPLEVEVYNVWLLMQQPFVTDPNSAQFLVEHGFDFNKQYRQGLPYTPAATRSKSMPVPRHSLDHVLAHLLQHRVPLVFHNGWLDILFLYHSCYGPLPPSSAALMADLTEMFPEGIYDTKAIAQFQFFEEASFLEYVFRICQRRNETSREEKRRYLELNFPLEARTDSYIERVEIGMPPALPLEQLKLISSCECFSAHGYCHDSSCNRSHDVLVAIDQRAWELSAVREKRKRRRMKRKLESPASENSAKRSCDSHETPEVSCDSHVTSVAAGDMSVVFQQELAAARAKLQASQQACQEEEAPPPQHSSKARSSLGHRAGFDAFMTGYAFACYALQSWEKGGKGGGVKKEAVLSKEGGEMEREREECVPSWPLGGVADMRNTLPSRARNWKVPLHILKSHFTKTSSTHITASSRLRQLVSTQEN